MKHIRLFFLIVLSFVLQSKMSVLNVVPDLTAAVVYYYGINNGAAKGIYMGSVIGLIEDSIGGGIIGPNMLGKGMVGFLSPSISGGLLRWTPYTGMLLIFVLTVMDGFVVFLSKALFEATPATVLRLVFTLLMQGFVNSMIGIFLRPKNAD